MSAAFVLHVITWLLVIQTTNWLTYLNFQTHCWRYLPYAVETLITTTLAYGLFGHVGISSTADDIDRLSLKISAQTICVAQNYFKHSQSEDEFDWVHHAYFKRKIKKCLSKKNKDETKHGNFGKNWLCQNFSCYPKNLSCPKFGKGEGGLAAPSSPRPVRLWVLYHLFLQSNTLKFQINFTLVRRLVKAWMLHYHRPTGDYVWKNLHDNRDRGKIKVQKYLENAVKSNLSVRADLSWPSLKKDFWEMLCNNS